MVRTPSKTPHRQGHTAETPRVDENANRRRRPHAPTARATAVRAAEHPRAVAADAGGRRARRATNPAPHRNVDDGAVAICGRSLPRRRVGRSSHAAPRPAALPTSRAWRRSTRRFPTASPHRRLLAVRAAARAANLPPSPGRWAAAMPGGRRRRRATTGVASSPSRTLANANSMASS
jgi:hypothetical protein